MNNECVYTEPKATLELTYSELCHLQNDNISYIYNIKKIVFGDAWSYGCHLSEEELELLDNNKKQQLITYGYYSRLRLKEKLDRFEKEHFGFSEVKANE